MQIKNQIVNYYVSPSKGGNPRIFESPAIIPAEVAYNIIQEQLEKNNKPALDNGRLLHVAFDVESKQIYIVNSGSFSPKEINPMLQRAKIKILKDHTDFSNTLPIYGSPYSLLRIRKVSNFHQVRKSVEKMGKEFVDLPVIEANLNRSPSTLKYLPDKFKNPNYCGGLIGQDFINGIPFFEEIDVSGNKTSKKNAIFFQPTPFILINTGVESSDDVTKKEWALFSGYRDFIYSKKESGDEAEDLQDLNAKSSFFAIKKFLYWGWSIEEVSSVFLNSATSFDELVNGINLIINVAKNLEQEGYKILKHPFYITFKIDRRFPLDIESIKHEGKINPNLQIAGFKVLEYNEETGYILIETPIYIPEEVILRLLKPANQPLVTHYNDATNTIDVKCEDNVFREYKSEKGQLGKIKALTTHDLKQENIPTEKVSFQCNERTRGTGADKNIFRLRKISDYPHAYSKIKELCDKKKMPFKDIDVLVGPIERIFGSGTRGGFMGEVHFRGNKMEWPYEITDGIFVSPPIISVDSVSSPSYLKQTETLVHEYSHNLYNITNPTHVPEYIKQKELRNTDLLKWWEYYLDDPDEREAHKAQFKIALDAGLSPDEIFRNKLESERKNLEDIGSAITMDNYKTAYPIALKLRELIEEAVKEWETDGEQNEQPK
jgi:hypothetical protein